VFVEGRFKTREFEGKDGEKRTSLDVISDNVISLERRGRDDEAGAFAGAPSGASGSAASGGSFGGGGSRPPADDTDIDDLPF
jgi:single-stranded DNA-binding protein